VLFNSYEFIFVFLPITLFGFFTIIRLYGRSLALTWLVVASLAFYSLWNPPYVFFLIGSIVVNYMLAQLIVARRKTDPRISAAATLFGVIGNLFLIGYFKYKNFFLDGVGIVFNSDFPGQEIILPLGISFFTFQQIAYLVDARVGVVGKSSFRDYALFVTFFPQLIAGPIVHHKEMMPQFYSKNSRNVSHDLIIGSVLFSVGLFKKAIIADGLAVYANPAFNLAATGTELDLFSAWLGALAYALQLYFDFSGYSEMALGLARMFGVTLPMNFNSPFKQSSIIDFWGHWHITLTRFFTTYIYNPIALKVTRSRAQNRLSLNRTTLGAFVMLVALPTMVTMLLAGLWHGAGTQYLVFGFLHGSYLTINHAWRANRSYFWPNDESYHFFMKPLGWLITFIAVVIGMVFFRADSVAAGGLIIQGMLGLNGALIPEGLITNLPIFGQISVWFGIESTPLLGKSFVSGYMWVIVTLGISLLSPNILHILRAHNPALGYKSIETKSPAIIKNASWLHRLRDLSWQATPIWLVIHIVLAISGILALSQVTEFLYWQF
jgi:alginate O-acetyltransferase complex protein AlgI